MVALGVPVLRPSGDFRWSDEGGRMITATWDTTTCSQGLVRNFEFIVYGPGFRNPVLEAVYTSRGVYVGPRRTDAQGVEISYGGPGATLEDALAFVSEQTGWVVLP